MRIIAVTWDLARTLCPLHGMYLDFAPSSRTQGNRRLNGAEQALEVLARSILAG